MFTRLRVVLEGAPDDYVNGPDLTGNVEALFIFWRT